MNTEKISVIVPVHNSANTLEYCLTSIVEQTYKNLEILLIENGSSDNSLELCRQWADKDERIKVLVSEKGVSKARNLGLENITGEYFAFVDSDDYLDVTAYEKLLSEAKKSGSDMTICKIVSVRDGEKKINDESKLETLVYDKEIRYFFYAGREGVAGGTIRALYETKKFKDIRFNVEMSYSEDLMYTLQCYDLSEKRSIVNEGLYFNVNFYHRAFNFAKKYKGRFNFIDSARIYALEGEKYLKKYNAEDVSQAPKYYALVLMINAIVGTEKHYVKEIKKLCKMPFWNEINTKTCYKQYAKTISTCGKAVKIKAYLVYRKMYRLYGLLAKLYAKIKG